jgi:uncharacterized membrane protein
MANINLSQSSMERNKHELNSVFDKSLLISSGLLIISFGTWLGLIAYNSSLDKKVIAVDQNITTQSAEIESGAVNRIVDFQERMQNVDQKLKSTDIMPQEMFALVEKLMVTGVSLDSYEYDLKTKTVSMKAMANEFKDIARQVTNFKSQSTFKSVIVGSTSKGSDGKVISDMIISL